MRNLVANKNTQPFPFHPETFHGVTQLMHALSTVRHGVSIFAALAVACLFAACGDAKPDDTDTAKIADSYWSASPPAGAIDIIAARTAAKDGAEITVVGLVQDYRDGQAQFFVADRQLIPCNERPGDACKTPWDYCCEDKARFRSGLLTVELRDGKKLVKSSLAGFHGFDRLKEAVVRGTAEIDSSGNVVLVASALHIRDADRKK